MQPIVNTLAIAMSTKESIADQPFEPFIPIISKGKRAAQRTAPILLFTDVRFRYFITSSTDKTPLQSLSRLWKSLRHQLLSVPFIFACSRVIPAKNLLFASVINGILLTQHSPHYIYIKTLSLQKLPAKKADFENPPFLISSRAN